MAFQFKFTRETIKPQIWCQNLGFSAAYFYDNETTEISLSALLKYKHFGQNSHDIFPPLDQCLHISRYQSSTVQVLLETSSWFIYV